MTSEGTPCGSWRVIAYVQGYEETVRWCERREGPCPFPATERSSTLGVNLGCAADGSGAVTE